jgi:kinesin family protein C1
MRVFCRIRPPIQREITKKLIDIEYRGDNSLIIKGEKKASNIGREGGNQDIEQFQFNRIFRPNDSQEDVFEEVAPLIQSS